jgi:hypothetical protein
MSSTPLPTSTRVGGQAGLWPMARIEMRRFVRHPAFVVGVVVAFGLLVFLWVTEENPAPSELLSMPVIPAFFIGLTSLVAAHRLTRSTDSAVEAVATAPGSEARRTAALAVACLVPFVAGALWIGLLLVQVATDPPMPQEWWFGTMPDLQVWSLLVALGPVACLGGGLLGVLSGRYLRFPGAAAVMVVVLVAVDLGGQAMAYRDYSELRLWVPWAMFHSGSETDGTSILFAGNAFWYLLYLLCLCAAAALVAVWHDKAARTRQLRTALATVVLVGLGSLALAVTTGNEVPVRSDPIPFNVDS